MVPLLTPESWRVLRQLIRLHGYDDLIRALRLQQITDILDPPKDENDDARLPDDLRVPGLR